ncbi:hypothetical protein QE152_g33700 [Popillia japonica]|uniref:Uncharacterized protein n=1 Tax=Popillia japonica TaxID=7064 RepID=A0AAW1IVU6_POPJA
MEKTEKKPLLQTRSEMEKTEKKPLLQTRRRKTNRQRNRSVDLLEEEAGKEFVDVVVWSCDVSTLRYDDAAPISQYFAQLHVKNIKTDDDTEVQPLMKPTGELRYSEEE